MECKDRNDILEFTPVLLVRIDGKSCGVKNFYNGFKIKIPLVKLELRPISLSSDGKFDYC